EYRQKVRAGLDAHPQQYAEKYGIDVSKWPTPDELLNPTVRTGIAESLPHHEFDDEVLRELGEVAPAAAARLRKSRRKMPREGERFLHFELLNELGRGAFARVFLARQNDLADRLVVLKIAVDLSGEARKLADRHSVV